MVIRDDLCRFLWNIGLTDSIRRLFSKGHRFVLVMHGVAGSFHPGIDRSNQPDLTASDLKTILKWLSENYHFLKPEEFFYSSNPGVLLTFDDGFANNYSVALPILEEYNAPAIFFVTLQHVLEPEDWLPATKVMVQNRSNVEIDLLNAVKNELYDGMNIEQLKSCADHNLITIGSHTLTHPFLSRCSDEELQGEIVGSKELIEKLIHKEVTCFAYPTGDYNAEVIKVVQEAGYLFAFASDPNMIGIPQFEIPRVGIYASDAWYLSMKLSGLHRRPIRSHPVCVQDTHIN